MNHYKYTGTLEVQLVGFGIIKPGEIISTDREINHPSFVIQKEKTEKKRTRKKS